MKFFIDTANIDEIKRAASYGLLDGVTTNPSLIAQTGRPFKEVIREICEVVDGPISAEVVSTDFEGIKREAGELRSLHENIVVKIPLIMEGLKATKWCSEQGIKTNVTLCFSPLQALLAAKAGATYISPFVGRLDDIAHEGMELIAQIIESIDQRRPQMYLEATIVELDEALHDAESPWLVPPFRSRLNDALERAESCGGHFREEYQTEEGEALRRDDDFAYSAVWGFAGVGERPELNKEPLTFDNVKLTTRSYK